MTLHNLDSAPPDVSLPDWLTRETVSQDGQKVRDEWAKPSRPSEDFDGQARLAAAMLMLHNERPRTPLFAQANVKALRWVDSRARASRAARIGEGHA